MYRIKCYFFFYCIDEYKYVVKICNVGDKSMYMLEIKYFEEVDVGEYMCILEIVGMRNFE